MPLPILNDTQIFQPARGYPTYLGLGQPVATPVSFFILQNLCCGFSESQFPGLL